MRGYITTILLLFISIFIGFEASAQLTQGALRTRYSLNDAWRFSQVYVPNDKAQMVDLPHTWSKAECQYTTAQYVRQLQFTADLSRLCL